MLYFRNGLVFFLILVLFACTSDKVQTEFQWKVLANERLTGLKTRLEKSTAEGPEVLVGQAKSGLELRVIEHPGGVKSMNAIFSRIELLLKSAYQEQDAPYPGQITKTVRCPVNFRPRPLPMREDAAAIRKGFLLMANDRRVFGACDASVIKFYAVHLLLACKTSDIVYEVKIFIPSAEKGMEELERIYDSFVCK